MKNTSVDNSATLYQTNRLANGLDFTATGKTNIVSWGMPDYSAEVTIFNNYTAPSDGFIFCGVNGNSSENVNINGHWVAITYNTNVSGSYPQLCLPVSKGDVFNTNANLNWARFYPLKGVN